MATKEEAKERIKVLVEEFRADYQRHREELESNTETKLVEPLFEALGWSKKDFVKQEVAHREGKRGHADYAFKIGDKTVFFLEAKRVGVPLEKEADKQVISYALSKRIPFAVSTNFEQLKVFCVEQEDAIKNVFRTFRNPEEYLENFHDLWFLSKESFEQNLTLKKAESENRLKKRASIDKELLDDLMRVRKLIVDDIEKRYPKKYEPNEKDDIVQRILDRLIFIRRSEDIGINPENLLLKEIEDLPGNKAHPKLKEIFRKYNEVYDSGLFRIGVDNDCDSIVIDGEIIKKLIQYLYESKGGDYVYNFDWIDADVLGQVYEQYLGRLLQQSRSGKVKLKEGQAHRKEQGIYYTPTHIVDYIVKNTVGELLKDKKIDPAKIKILDPACGSGSFLIKAFDYLNERLSKGEETKQRRLDSQGMYSVKTDILKKNVYGVDLDHKAIEITKLNLLLKAAERDRKLPEELDVHIKRGNSLIDDESVAGLNAFRWTDDFEGGGFDVVIGNPPWLMAGYHTTPKEIDYLHGKYESAKGKFDLYYCFIEKALTLISNRGIFGMIVPNKFFHTKSAKGLREILMKSGKLYKIVDFGDEKVFGDATNYSSILLLRQGNHKKITYTEVDARMNIKKDIQIDAQSLTSDGWYFEDKTEKSLFNKVNSIGTPLIQITKRFGTGAQTGADKVFLFTEEEREDFGTESKLFCKILRGRDVRRYSISRITKQAIFPYKVVNNKFQIFDEEEIKKYKKGWQTLELNKSNLSKRIWFGKNATQLSGKYYGFMYLDDHSNFKVPHILTPSLSDKSNFSIGTGDIFVTGTAGVTSVILKSIPESINYILGLLNWKLISFYVIKRSPIFQGGYHKFSSNYLKKIPIKRIDMNKSFEMEIYNSIVKRVDKMLSLNKRLNEIGGKKTEESAKIWEAINKSDKEIDQLVYKLYGLTKEEIKIVEGSVGK